MLFVDLSKLKLSRLLKVISVVYRYVIHESAAWSPFNKKWYFLPRRASNERYNDVDDEHRATNLMITADAHLNNMETTHIGVGGFIATGLLLQITGSCFHPPPPPPPTHTHTAPQHRPRVLVVQVSPWLKRLCHSGSQIGGESRDHSLIHHGIQPLGENADARTENSRCQVSFTYCQLCLQSYQPCSFIIFERLFCPLYYRLEGLEFI